VASPPECGDYVDCQGNRVASIGLPISSSQVASICNTQNGAVCPPGSAAIPSTGYCIWGVRSSCPLGLVCIQDFSGAAICRDVLGSAGVACKTTSDCQCGLDCENNFCADLGGGGPGTKCYRPCDCMPGYACLSPLEGGAGTCVEATPPPDAGTDYPYCGDYVDCFGHRVSSGRQACNPQQALTCPVGTVLDSMQYCMESELWSCADGAEICKYLSNGSYACSSPAAEGQSCLSDTDCACGLACAGEKCAPVETLIPAANGQTAPTDYCSGTCPAANYCSIDITHTAGYGWCVPLATRACPPDAGAAN
jgi:hypothetical protein